MSEVDEPKLRKGSQRFITLLEQMRRTHLTKSAGYAADDPDVWANFRQSETFGVPALQGCMVRLSDKYIRAANLLRNPAFDQVGEPLKDTLLDLASYALIAICMLEEGEQRGVANPHIEPASQPVLPDRQALKQQLVEAIRDVKSVPIQYYDAAVKRAGEIARQVAPIGSQFFFGGGWWEIERVEFNLIAYSTDDGVDRILDWDKVAYPPELAEAWREAHQPSAPEQTTDPIVTVDDQERFRGEGPFFEALTQFHAVLSKIKTFEESRIAHKYLDKIAELRREAVDLATKLVPVGSQVKVEGLDIRKTVKRHAYNLVYLARDNGYESRAAWDMIEAPSCLADAWRMVYSAEAEQPPAVSETYVRLNIDELNRMRKRAAEEDSEQGWTMLTLSNSEPLLTQPVNVTFTIGPMRVEPWLGDLSESSIPEQPPQVPTDQQQVYELARFTAAHLPADAPLDALDEPLRHLVQFYQRKD